MQPKRCHTKRLADILANMSAYRGKRSEFTEFQRIVYDDLVPLAIEATDAINDITSLWAMVDGDIYEQWK